MLETIGEKEKTQATTIKVSICMDLISMIVLKKEIWWWWLGWPRNMSGLENELLRVIYNDDSQYDHLSLWIL